MMHARVFVLGLSRWALISYIGTAVLVGGRTSTDWDGWTAKANDRAAKRKQCEGGN